jgi:heat-inducible transcriptional repressor
LVEVGLDPGEALLGELRARLNASTSGRRLSEVAAAVAALPNAFALEDRALVQSVLEALEDSLSVEREERIVLAGTANLARSGPDFARSIGPVLEALEEQVVLLKLLSEMAEDLSAVGVRIGRETTVDNLAETAVVASGYGSQGEIVARLGVLGPTRMDYPMTMAAVRAVARYVSRILSTG